MSDKNTTHKTIVQKTSAQVEFGFKTEKIATNENVYYHFIEKEKKRIVFFMLNKYLGLKNRKPHAEIDFVEFHFERWRGNCLNQLCRELMQEIYQSFFYTDEINDFHNF